MRRFLTGCVRWLSGLVALGFTGWGALALAVVGPGGDAGRLFLEYMRKLNALRERSEFYNTLTTNCTTAILLNTRVNPDSLPFAWKVLLSGYTPAYVYETGRTARTLPFEELKRRSLVNAAAQVADQAPDFSRRIRAGRPPSGR